MNLEREAVEADSKKRGSDRREAKTERDTQGGKAQKTSGEKQVHSPGGKDLVIAFSCQFARIGKNEYVASCRQKEADPTKNDGSERR